MHFKWKILKFILTHTFLVLVTVGLGQRVYKNCILQLVVNVQISLRTTGLLECLLWACHQLLPYIFKRQPKTAHQLSLLMQAALMQINEELHFRSPRLATRFECNAANIAKVLVKALLNLLIKFNSQEISGSKKQSRSYILRFFLKNSSSRYQRRFAIGGYTTMFFVAKCLVSFLRAVPKTTPKSLNSSASVLKTSSHKRRRWKTAKHWFCWILGDVEQKWCRKYRKWLCCETFVTKSKLKASLAVWRNLLPNIFQGGLQPV